MYSVEWKDRPCRHICTSLECGMGRCHGKLSALEGRAMESFLQRRAQCQPRNQILHDPGLSGVEVKEVTRSLLTHRHHCLSMYTEKNSSYLLASPTARCQVAGRGVPDCAREPGAATSCMLCPGDTREWPKALFSKWGKFKQGSV